MNTMITTDDAKAGAIDYEKEIVLMLDEIKRTNEKIEREQEEITSLKIETREILNRLNITF